MDGFFPQVVFSIAGIEVRDTIVSTWLMMVAVLALAIVIRRRRPIILEMVLDMLESLIGDLLGGYRLETYLPFLGSLAIFVAFANLFSILPTIPLPGGAMLPIVAPTRDLNTPIALAIVVFFSVHYYGMRQQGVFGYLKSLASPIFLLPLEIIGQVSRTVSLAVRLFGNVLSTELIVMVVFMLVPLLVPLPVIGLNIFTGLLQAYIFTALAAVYISTGLEEPEENEKLQGAAET
ncbi:MAG: F0F1 ATP synthase subunit A [Anaerolineae bacterium]|nr:F0F1 ATP synthase subunit A [Anaerolineae bacterium]